MPESASQVSYWRAGLALPQIPSRPLPGSTDVVVVGSGYTGISAALTLAEAGAGVVVLEAEEAGFGASTRNGGIVHPGLKLSLPELSRRYGVLGRELYAETVEGFHHLEDLIETRRIKCDYRRTGHVLLAHHERRASALRRAAMTYRLELQEEARFLERAELKQEIGSDAYHGGLLVELSGALHPGKFYAGLLNAALGAGVEVHEHTPLLDIRRTPSGQTVILTPDGTMLAGRVLVATNGYTGQAFPELRRRIIPIGSFIVVTEPLQDDVVESLSPHGRSFFDTRNFLNYWRLLPDGRLLFGGRSSFAPTGIREAGEILYHRVTSIHPEVSGVGIDYAWGGTVGFTFDRLPHTGRFGNVTYAMGYCGTGVALSTYLGSRCGSWLLGRRETSRFARLPFPTAPFYHGSPWFLRPAGAYYQLRDRTGW